MLRAVNTNMTHSNPTLQMTGSPSKSMGFLIPEASFLTSAFQPVDSGLAPSGGKDVLAAASPEQLPETIRSFLQTAIPSLPRRVEIHLATPEGARVTLFIARSNGELRAQLSTSDPTVLQWLQQQVQSLRQTQWGSMVNWLPPQREEEKPAGENPRNMENRRRAPQRDEAAFAAWSATDVTEPTLSPRK